MTKGCLTFENDSDRLFSPIARELICWRGAPERQPHPAHPNFLIQVKAPERPRPTI
jgi:hypothetical protein